MAEIDTAESYYNRRGGYKPKREERIKRDAMPIQDYYNPDPLLADRRKGLELYERMRQDSVISTALLLRKDITLSVNWYIDAPEDDANAQAQAEFVKGVLDGMQGMSFADFLDALLDYESYGFLVSEPVWYVQDGRWYIKDIKVKDPKLFHFEVDDYGNLTYIVENIGYNKYAPDGFVVAVHPYVFNGNWFGTSCLQAVYSEWFAKKEIMKFRNQYLQNRAGAPLMGVYPKGNEQAKTVAAAICDALQNDYFAVVPGSVGPDRTLVPDIQVTKMDVATSSGTADFDSAISQLDRAITRGLLLPDNLGYTDTSSGSYAQSRTQLRQVFFGVKKRLDRLEGIINGQIVKRILSANFAQPAEVKFCFENADDEVSESRAKVINILVKAGIVEPDEMFVRRYLNLPEKEESEEMPDDGGNESMPESAPDNDSDEDTDIPGADMREVKYIRDLDFTEIRATFDSVENKTIENVSAILGPAMDKMIAEATKKFIEPKTLKYLDTLKLTGLNDIRDEMIRGMTEMYLRGKIDTSDQIKSYSGTAPADFSDYTGLDLAEVDFAKLGFQGIDKWLTQYGTKLSAQDKANLRSIAERAYLIAGNDIADTLLVQVRKIIKSGVGVRTTGQIVQDVRNVCNTFLDTALTDPNTPGSVAGALESDLSIGRVKTIVRNAVSTEYNQGSVAQALDDSLQGFVEYAQYAAILDDVTSPFCRAHDGEIVEVGSPDFIQLTPPNHHNCRSTWIYIFRGEDVGADWDNKSDKALETIGITRKQYTNGLPGFGKAGT